MSVYFDSAFPQQLYTNVPVVRGLRSIRLLRVHAGLRSDPISCDLFGVFLANAPPYKALSYAWFNGRPASPEVVDCTIACNGFVMNITANLHAALRRLRERDRSVDIWVDSICINQKDLLERSDQVAIMREIYNNSTEVVIWLGERGKYDHLGDDLMPGGSTSSLLHGLTPDDEDVICHIDWFGDERDRDKWESFLQRQNNRQHVFDVHIRDVFGAFCVLWLLSIGVRATEIVHLRHISQSTSIINGLLAIVEQSWWRRTWVIQETVVASKATVYYSNISAPWSMFAQAAVAYDRGSLATSAESAYPYLQPLAQFARTVVEMEGTRRTWTDTSRLTTLLPLLRMFRSRRASDPRDKVFALLGLVQYWGGSTAEGGRQDKIKADYNMDADRVFWKTTTMLIKQMKSLDVLMGTLGGASATGGQSWVTDWSFPPDMHENSRVSNIRFYDAAKGAGQGLVKVHGLSVLEIHGRPFDEVVFVAPELSLVEENTTGPVGRGTGNWRAVVSEWERSLSSTQGQAAATTYGSSENVADAFWRTVCADIECIRDTETSRAGFRRIARPAERSLTYAKWRAGDPSRKRRTSIIAGYWQENGGENDPDTKDCNAFHHAVECASGRRRFFLTRGGFMGTGPRDMTLGDEVFIVASCRVPFILRRAQEAANCIKSVIDELIELPNPPTYIQAGAQAKSKLRVAGPITCNEQHKTCFSAIGDAYIHGIMDGQASSLLPGEGSRKRMTGSIFLV